MTKTKKPRTHFGRCLLRLRKERGLSLYRLARITGLSGEALRKLELDSEPSFRTAQRLAAALGVTLDALADPAEIFPKNPPTAIA